VPTVNSALKRAVTPQRFKSMQQQSAGQSAALAAIAQAVMADTSAVKTSTDLDKWYEYCAEMRTAAGAVNSAIHAQDEAATTAAMSRLAASCETCHKVFRKE
jgi:cytochrome c556